MADALGTGGSVVSAADHRLDQAGLIAPQSSTLDVRKGVMWGPGATTVVTGTSATGTMTVNIAAHHWVASRATSDGIYLGTKETSTTVNIAAAPGSNSRIDVVWSKQNDAGSTITPDGSTVESYGVTAGTAAAVPVKPTIPVGAVEIATVTVATGATSTNGAGVTIANTAALVVARGADIPVRNQAERDALTTFPFLTVKRLDTGAIEKRDVSNTGWETVFTPGGTGTAWTSYTPTWTAASSAPSVGNGSMTGRYRKNGRQTHFNIDIIFGTTTSGGSGAWTLTLPVATLASIQQVAQVYAIAADNTEYSGVFPLPGGTSSFQPRLPAASSVSRVVPIANASSGGAVGTGNPTITGAFSFQNGSRVTISGVYEAAS